MSHSHLTPDYDNRDGVHRRVRPGGRRRPVTGVRGTPHQAATPPDRRIHKLGRDAGVTVRPRAGIRRRRTVALGPLLGSTLIVAAVLILAAQGGSGAEADASDTPLAVAESVPAPSAAIDREGATPFFASYRSLHLRLPVDPADLTALAFHQAAGSSALHLTSLVPDADMDLAAELNAVPDAGDTGAATNVWDGVCLRLWRTNRGGEPDTAVDAGAEPGAAVWSPVTGTVVAVRPYRLYDAYDDYEIHIRPDGWDTVDVVLIHVDDVRVKAGDPVAAGLTRLASVRKMSDKIEIQLGGYTANGGDHVHMQLNEIDSPGALTDPGGS